jgi:hypothetical protein
MTTTTHEAAHTSLIEAGFEHFAPLGAYVGDGTKQFVTIDEYRGTFYVGKGRFNKTGTRPDTHPFAEFATLAEAAIVAIATLGSIR